MDPPAPPGLFRGDVMVVGNIELQRDGDFVWARDLRSGEAQRLPLSVVARIAERWFWRLF